MDWPRKRKQPATSTSSLSRFASRSFRNANHQRIADARSKILESDLFKAKRVVPVSENTTAGGPQRVVSPSGLHRVCNTTNVFRARCCTSYVEQLGRAG